MDLITQFAASIGPKDEAVLQDVMDFIQWQTIQGEDKFYPLVNDDVAIRTYLLDCRVRGITRPALNRIDSSLERFYAWLKTNDLIQESPFEIYNLKRPFLDPKMLLPRHDAFTGRPDEREIARLRALNRLAESHNQALDVRSLLNGFLETMLGAMSLNTAWISLKVDSGLIPIPDPSPEHGFVLAAAHNLPPGLEVNDRYYLRRPPECHCQQLLGTGQLRRGVNMVECSRLQDALEARENNAGLMFHASVPITLNGQAIGVMNFAAEDWQLLSASDLQFLNSGARQLDSALERARLYDLVKKEQERLEQELDLARKLQISLFPQRMPEIAGYSLAAYWQPAHETSGDYYNIFELPGGLWGFIVADVVGKGAPAALRMAMAHSLIRERVESETSPAALLTYVNRALYDQNLDMQFITAFYAILDPENAILKYAIAGHPPPFLRKSSSKVKKIAGRGIALGVSFDAQYEEKRLTLAPGDILVAFTDGVTDANNPSHETFNMAQLRNSIGSAPACAEDLLEHLHRCLIDWVKETPNYDDITLLAIGREQPEN
jgi:serine phosphatase RsbU (regulator of sigma subunit)